MTLAAGCPRCTSAVTAGDDGWWECPDHGRITPLWRPAVADYEALAEHLTRCGQTPTLALWPLPPGWGITDFGCVAMPGHDARASMLSCSGLSDLDGLVELTIVSEEPGVGLGARYAGIDHTDPGAEVGEGRPCCRVDLEGTTLPLWPVSVSGSRQPATRDPWQTDPGIDRSVFAGEAHGRWLWLVLRPASAALLLGGGETALVDLSGLGPELIDVPFRENPPPW